MAASKQAASDDDVVAGSVLRVDYELMQNWILGSPLSAGTEVAVCLNDAPGGDDPVTTADVFTLDATRGVVTQTRYDPDDDTGWASTELATPPLTSGETVTALAAIQTPDGQQVVVVGTDHANVFSLTSIDASTGVWNGAWTTLTAPAMLAGPVHRLVLATDSTTVFLVSCAAKPDYAGTADFYEVMAAELGMPDGAPPSWSPGHMFDSDSCLVSASPFLDYWMVNGLVTPTLVIYPTTESGVWDNQQPCFWDAAVWDTTGSDYYEAHDPPGKVGIWRVLPRNPGDMVLGDAVVAGEGEPPAVGLCAGLVPDPTGSTDVLLKGAQDVSNRIWSHEGTSTSNGSVWGVDPPDGYVASGYVGSAAEHHSNFGDGSTLSFDGTTVTLGTVRQDLVAQTLLDAQPLWYTVKGHGKPVWFSQVLGPEEEGSSPTGMLAVSTSDEVNLMANFAAPGCHRANSVVAGMDPETMTSPTAQAGSDQQQFVNWCRSPAGAQAAVSSDGGLWFLAPGASTWVSVATGAGCIGWTPTTGGTLAACEDGTGAVHVFAIDDQAHLLHLVVPPGETGGTPLPIVADVAAVTVVPTAPGAQAGPPRLVVTTSGAAPALLHLALDGDDWTTTVVTPGLAADGSSQLDEITTYTCHLDITDSAGSPMPNAGVTIASDRACCLVLNGQATRLLPSHPVAVEANVQGRLTAVTQTSDLTAPVLFIIGPDAGPGQVRSVVPNSKVVAQLATADTPSLEAACDADGEPLLTGPNREDTAKNMVEALVQLAAVANGTSAAMSRRVPPRTPMPFAGDGGPTPMADTDQPVAFKMHFVPGEAPTFKPLDDDEAAAEVVDMRARLDVWDSGIWSSLKDAWSDVMAAAKAVENTIVSCVVRTGKTLRVAIELVIDGVKWLYEAAMTAEDYLSAALDLVVAFFVQVGVAVERVVQWLAYLFNWDNILRTQQATVHAIDQVLDFLQDATGVLKTKFEDGLESFVDDQVKPMFDSIIEEWLPANPNTIGSFEGANRHPIDGLDSPPAQLVTNHLLQQAPGATPPNPSTSMASVMGDNDGIQAVLDQVQDLVNTYGAGAEMQQALDYFKAALESEDGYLELALLGLVKAIEGIVLAVLGGVKALVDALLDALAAVIAGIKSAIDAAWEIPVLSDLYRKVTTTTNTPDGQDLTVGRMVALIAAVPATVVYTAIEGEAPFPDDASLQAFQDTFTASLLLTNSGLGTTPADRDAAARDVVSSDASNPWPKVFACLRGGVLVATAAVEPVVDIQLPDGFVPKKRLKFDPTRTSVHFGASALGLLSLTVLSLEIADVGLATPWIDGAKSWNVDSSDFWDQIGWLKDAGKMLVDGAFFFAEQSLPRQVGEWGTLYETLSGYVDLPIAFAVAILGEPLSGASGVIGGLGDLLRVCRLPEVVEATEGISLLVLVGSDLLGNGAEAGLAIAGAWLDPAASGVGAVQVTPALGTQWGTVVPA